MTDFSWTKLPRGFTALSPMAGVTDSPFRRICKKMGADVIFTEMISSEALLHNHDTTTKIMLYFEEWERPVVGQLMGSEAERMAEAARRLEAMGFDGVDINMGCPAKKIVGNACGSSLLDDPERAAAIVRAMVEAVEIPVSVKMRSGVSGRVQPEFALRMVEAGASALTIHPRTKEQAYRGQADWSITREIARTCPVPVMGSGDLMSWGDVERLFAETNCAGAFIARGSMGNPWIFKRAAYTPSIPEMIEVVREQCRLMLELKGQHGLIEMRKHLGWYFKGFDGAAEVRNRANSVVTMDDIEELFAIVRARSGELRAAA